MGVDVELLLPPTTRVDDFGRALARVLGHPVVVEREDYGPYKGVSYAAVAGLRIVGDVYLPTTAHIRLFNADETSEPYYDGLWEYETPTGWRSIFLKRSTPLWCAVGDRLHRFFGGYLKYQDDAGAWDRVKDPVYLTAPATGDAWDEFQMKIANIPPLSAPEVKDFFSVAAYDESPDLPPWLKLVKA
jgi:hypothetical protein